MKKIIAAYVALVFFAAIGVSYYVAAIVSELPKALGSAAAEAQRAYEAGKNQK